MSAGPKLLIVGAGGQLSRALAERAPGARVLGRDVADLSDPAATEAAVAEAVAATGAEVVVNAAAYTAVDRAEQEPELAETVNGAGAGAVARGAAAGDAAVVHVSTDYVFDGSKPGEWTEDDPVAPLGVYGRTKLAGEGAVAAATPRHAVLRTAWVHSPFGANFVKTMLRLADRDRLTVVADQAGKPTSALDLADAILAIAPTMVAGHPGDGVFGVFHYSGRGVTTWADFADAIFDDALARGMIAARPEVARIPTSEYPTPATRPANSALDCTKFERVFGVETVGWRVALGRVLDRLAREEGTA